MELDVEKGCCQGKFVKKSTPQNKYTHYVISSTVVPFLLKKGMHFIQGINRQQNYFTTTDKLVSADKVVYF